MGLSELAASEGKIVAADARAVVLFVCACVYVCVCFGFLAEICCGVTTT